MKIIALLFLFATSAFAKPCGTEGTLEARIKECNFAKGEFVLVARNDKGQEIYKDTKSELLWGPRISYEFNHLGSAKACDDDLVEAKLLKDLKWRLPTISELEQVFARGMKESLPDTGYYFWSSTPAKMTIKNRRGRRRTVNAGSYMWDGEKMKSEPGALIDVASVRCVTKG